jgi:hypothetical protein
MTPRSGNTLLFEGVIGQDEDPETLKEAVVKATDNAVSAFMTCMREGEQVSQLHHVVVYIAAEPGFAKHAAVADHASRHLLRLFGEETIGSRAAIGVASLPSNAPVEISINVIVK